MSQLRKIYSDIYDKNVAKIYRFILFKVKSAEIAEDLTSEVFLRGWESFKEDRDKIENVQAFLYRVARNLLADHYRHESKAPLVSVDEASPIIDQGQDLEEQSFLWSDMERVKTALAEIHEEYREVIILYYLDELKASEIAQILDRSEVAVRVLIHRALTALKTELQRSVTK
jgi:RNA polymerase sigma-70 factor (ECF subfamily)